jgi:hypothetical protein
LTILVIVLIVLAAIFLVLLLPVYLEVSVAVHGSVDFRVRLIYFFRLLTWELGGRRGTAKVRKIKVTKRPSLSSVFEAAQVEGLWERVGMLVKRLANAMKISSLESDITVSLGDDYYTGMLVGLALPLVIFLNEQFDYGLSLIPAFEEDLMLEGYLSGSLRVRPITVVAPITSFMLSRPVWHAGRILNKDK